MIMYICDSCDKVEDAGKGIKGELIRPNGWFVIHDGEGEKHACTDECCKFLSKPQINTSDQQKIPV